MPELAVFTSSKSGESF